MAGFKVKFSLKWKFIIQVMLLILITAVSLSYYLINNSKTKQLQSLQAKSRLILENLNMICSEGIVQDDIIVINDAIKRYADDPEIDYIVVYNPRNGLMFYNDGTVIADAMDMVEKESLKKFIINKRVTKYLAKGAENFTKIKKPGAMPKPLRRTYRNRDKDIIFEYYLPIKYKTPFIRKQLGTIRIGFNTRLVFASIAATRNRIFILVAGVLVVAIIGTFLSSSSLITPIRKLAAHFQQVGEGDLHKKISINRRDELGQLAHEFDDMTGKLDKAQKELIEKSLLERDIEVASEIQASLLPDNYYKKEHLEMAGYSKPAKGVGGDYFDFLTIGENLEGVVICDVAGKGIPASLLMVMLKTVFHVSAESHITDTKTICGIANKFIAKTTPPSRFATAHYAVINRDTGEMKFTNAGHGDLYIYRKAKGDYETISLKDNIPIGMVEMSTYNEVSVKLEKGDVIIFFTDGVSEARNTEEQEYSKERVTDIVKAAADKEVKEISKLLLDDITAFVGERAPHDDLTYLVVKYS